MGSKLIRIQAWMIKDRSKLFGLLGCVLIIALLLTVTNPTKNSIIVKQALIGRSFIVTEDNDVTTWFNFGPSLHSPDSDIILICIYEKYTKFIIQGAATAFVCAESRGCAFSFKKESMQGELGEYEQYSMHNVSFVGDVLTWREYMDK